MLTHVRLNLPSSVVYSLWAVHGVPGSVLSFRQNYLEQMVLQFYHWLGLILKQQWVLDPHHFGIEQGKLTIMFEALNLTSPYFISLLIGLTNEKKRKRKKEEKSSWAEVANEFVPPVSKLIISTPSIASVPNEIALTLIPDCFTVGITSVKYGFWLV